MTPETPAERHRRIAGAFTDLVTATDRWDVPSPVPEWSARDVVDHLLTWLPGLLHGGSQVRLPEGPSAGDDPVGGWRGRVVAVQEVLDDPARAGADLTNPHVGERSVADAIDRLYTTDVLMHSWDLARATGQQPPIAEGEAAALLAGMEPLEEMLRSSGQYGPRVAVPDDASAVDRLAGFLGRDPAWRAG